MLFVHLQSMAAKGADTTTADDDDDFEFDL